MHNNRKLLAGDRHLEGWLISTKASIWIRSCNMLGDVSSHRKAQCKCKRVIELCLFDLQLVQHVVFSVGREGARVNLIDQAIGGFESLGQRRRDGAGIIDGIDRKST